MSGGGTEAWANLGNAIIIQAVADYKTAYKDFKKGDHNIWLNECTNFFHSDWFHFLAPDVDGDKILEAARTQAEYELWRKEHKCTRCRKETCIHKSGSKWFTWGTKDCVCMKKER